MNYAPGDRVTTLTGRTGTIEPSPYLMSVYKFVHFDDGTKFFILNSILKPLK